MSFLREEEHRLNQYNSSPQYLKTSIELGAVVHSRGNLDFNETTPLINKEKSNLGFGSTVSSFQSKGLQLKAMGRSLTRDGGENAMPASPQPGQNKKHFMDGDPRMNVTHTDVWKAAIPPEILDQKSNNVDMNDVRSGAGIEDEDFGSASIKAESQPGLNSNSQVGLNSNSPAHKTSVSPFQIQQLSPANTSKQYQEMEH